MTYIYNTLACPYLKHVTSVKYRNKHTEIYISVTFTYIDLDATEKDFDSYNPQD